MRVLMLSQFYPPVVGGEERHVRNLALALTARGHEVHVGTQAVDLSSPAEQIEDGVRVHRLRGTAARFPSLYAEASRPHALPVPDPELARGLRVLADTIAPDVVHAHNWIVNSWLPAQLRHRRPLVLTLHDYSDRCATKRLMYEGAVCSGPGLAKCSRHTTQHYGRAKGPAILGALWAERPVKHRLVDRYLAVSRAVAEGNGLRGDEVEVVPNFVADALSGQAPGVRPAALPAGPYLLFVGDVIREKGVHTLLEAYAGLGPDRPALLLVGRAGRDTPVTLPAGAQRVEAMSHDDVVAAFQHASAAVLPSEWADPCPTTVLEAMALGTPVVTTAIGGMVDMVDHEVSGLLVQPGDPAGLRAALTRLATEAGLADRLVEGARLKVRSFSASLVAERVEAVYAELSGQPR